MAKLYAIENKLVKIGNSYLGELTVYDVHTYNDGHGSITAVPSSGNTGTIVTLSNTPNSGYEFDEYVVEGATLSGNTLTIAGSDVSVTGTFKAAAYPLDSVTIGNQVWTSKNLAITDNGSGITIMNSVRGCNNEPQYYYTYDAAQRIVANLPGWHIPSREEFETLISTVGAESAAKLSATTGWDNQTGTNDYGFNARPASYLLFGSSQQPGKNACWWSTTGSSSNRKGMWIDPTYYNYAYITDMDTSYITATLRLIKD